MSYNNITQEENMKLLIISGTPKKDGLCHSLVTAAYESAAGSGAEAEIINLSDLKLLPCKMCDDGWGICGTEHRCIYGDEDGFNLLQEKFAPANAFVFITPVYWGEVSEGLKCFFDRLRRCQATKNRDMEKIGFSFFADKSSILVASAGGSGNGILSALTQMERAVSHMGGDKNPKDRCGICDLIGVNRWNQDYKREALKAAVEALVRRLKE